jgi:cytochrome c2
MKKVFRVVLTILLVLIVAVFALGFYIKKALPNVGAAPDLKVEITPERVARGKYLANYVMICMDCHSQRDWTKYAGPIIPGKFGAGGEKFGKEMGFPGNLYSKNLTPYHLRDWTDGEIFRAITCGETKDGKALFPLMGYPSYGKLDREDIYDVIAYIRTLPEIKNDVPQRELDFPLNYLVNTMPSKASFVTRPDSNNTLPYGQYLITAARCVDCHSKINKGKIIAGTEYGGGDEFPFPNGTVAYSANITPDKETGIGNWTKEIFIARFKQYADSSYHPQSLGKNDFNTPMPWLMYAGMTTKDLFAIYAYLQTVKPIKNNVQHFVRKS